MTHFDPKAVRAKSLEQATGLGYPANPHLPLSDSPAKSRPVVEVVDRLLVLHGVVATAYGFPAKKALNWLRAQSLEESLTLDERRFLEKDKRSQSKANQRRWEIDAAWALAWCACFVEPLDFVSLLPNDFVEIFPDLNVGESADAFRRRAVIRDSIQVVEKCGLAYCLHWAVRDAQLNHRPIPGVVEPTVIIHTRHALEWVLDQCAWDEVSLDT